MIVESNISVGRQSVDDRAAAEAEEHVKMAF
jgi:hypothetical protein